MENLSGSLKDAHSVNVNLENLLAEKRQKRILLEEKLEKVNTKLAAAQDQHSKLTETWKVTQHKVTQAQAQNDRIEKTNEEKRQLLLTISQEINDCQQKRNIDILAFVESLSKLANKIMKAKDEYSTENLRKELDATIKEHQLLCSNGQKLDEDLTAVKTFSDRTSIQTEIVNDGIDRDLVIQILTDEKKTLQNKIDQIKESLCHDGDSEMTE